MTIPRVFGDYPHVLLLGTSPGTYSSRAAVSLASPRILAKDSKENPIVENSPYLVKYLAPYYSPEFFDSIKLGNTGTFYTPFSSVLGIIIEYGLIGCLLFILLFRNIIKLNKKILKVHNIGAVNIILTFALIMVFFYDTWFEHSMIMLPYLISLGYAFSLNKIPTKTENHRGQFIKRFKMKQVIQNCSLSTIFNMDDNYFLTLSRHWFRLIPNAWG